MAENKDTIYLDVDEEITSIVNKVHSSPKKIVALVLPKRAAVFQSVVNMKLLKRTADQNDKNVVLITSESALMPLAGAAGVYVASNLNSKPFIPPSPRAAAPATGEDEDVQIDPSTPVGDLAEPEESIEIDNSAPAATKESAKTKKKSGGKKPKVPNFDKFRKKMLAFAVLGAILLFGIIWAIFLSPKATVTLKTESSEIPVNIDFIADENASEVNAEQKIVPASKKEQKNEESEKSSATGTKDKGAKAGGTVTMTNCGDSPATIPAGTGVSSGNQTYLTQSSVSLTSGNFDSGGNCKTSGSHVGTTSVVAQNKGEEYNAAPRSYSVSGFSNVTANGSKMSGGSSEVVKVVSDQDVETAKQKIEAKKDDVKKELEDSLKGDGYIPITDSFTDNSPKYKVSPAVGTEADEVTVSAEITYTMLGVKEDDMKKLIEESVKDQVNSDKQSILSYGLAQASYKPSDSEGDQTPINMQTTVSVGPDLDQEEIKTQIAGKKSGEAEEILKGRPGVIDVKVEVKPGWASKVPKKTSKITIVIEDANGNEINTSDQAP